MIARMGKKKAKPKVAVAAKDIERAIHIVRGQRVMLDVDLANLYGVTTRRVI